MSTRVETGQHGGTVVISLAGEIDRFAASELRHALGCAESQGRDVVLDLTRTLFVDSTALGAIAAAAQRFRWGGRGFALVVPDRNLRRTLRITAIDLLCAVRESPAEAIHALERS